METQLLVPSLPGMVFGDCIFVEIPDVNDTLHHADRLRQLVIGRENTQAGRAAPVRAPAQRSERAAAPGPAGGDPPPRGPHQRL